MPGFKTIFRALIAAGLLFGYYELPGVLEKQAGTPVLAVTPSDVTGVTITGLGPQSVSITRVGAGWGFEGRPGLLADASQLNRLLSGLATATCRAPDTQRPIPSGAPTVTLHATSGQTTVITLGPRLVALQCQLISVNGEVLEIDRDLSACLGFWEREAQPSADQLVQKTRVYLEGEGIKRVQLSNPVAAYDFVRTSQTFSFQRDANVPAETAHTWREQGEHKDQVAFSLALHDYCRALGMLTVGRLATPAEVAAPELPYNVRFETDAGRTFRFAVSGPIGDNREHLLKMEEPPCSGLFVIGPVVFRNVVPNGASFFEGVRAEATGAESATEVMYERDGHQCVLTQRGEEWRVLSPRVPYKVFTPPAEMPGDTPVSMAEGYVMGLRQFSSRELFLANTPERQELLRAGLGSPAARATLKLAGGRSVAVAVSPPIQGTDMVFVAVGRTIVIAGRGTIRHVAPDIAHFFDPEEVKGKEIRW